METSIAHRDLDYYSVRPDDLEDVVKGPCRPATLVALVWMLATTPLLAAPFSVATRTPAHVLPGDVRTEQDETILISRASGADGDDANDFADFPSLSADGRYVSFVSSANNIHPDDTDASADAYVRDVQTHETILVSRASGADGVKANSGSGFVTSVSADGRYVAFYSAATNLDPDDTDSIVDVYVRDVQTHETTLVSRATGVDGTKADNHSFVPSISADGRFVAFSSRATNLHPDDSDNGIVDVYVRDLQAHETILVSRASGTDVPKGDGQSFAASISADGRYVAFQSSATNLHPDDSDALFDVFVRDLQTAETILVSRASGADGVKGNRISALPSVSADGHYVTFQSQATNLHPDDSDTRFDVIVRDLHTHETMLASRATGVDGVKSNGDSFEPAISTDGRHVAFQSAATNFDPDDTSGVVDVYVRDLQAHETILVSRASGADGDVGNGGSRIAAVSAKGRFVAFHSGATNLHPDDTDGLGVLDVFLRDVQGPPGQPELMFDPASLDFGDVEVGTTSPSQTGTLHNIGDADATGLAFDPPGNGFEADTGACADTLPAGGTCVVGVAFTPAAPGPAEATVHVDSNEGAMADLDLSGNGTGEGGPMADISPDAFEFEVSVGGSDTQTLNIGNVGDGDLDWSLEEAEAGLAPEGVPYAYGLAGATEFHAPVGYDRASGRVSRLRGAPADPIVMPASQPAAIDELEEGFDDITLLPGAGWALINNSEPLGPSSWFQGNPTIFPAHEGDPDAYIAANYESTDGAGTISNWLITPEVTIVNGTELRFWTRTTEPFEEFFDRLEVRLSVEGDSVDVGDTAESVGDFTELLLTINEDLEPGEYPEEWTEYVLTVRGRSREPVTGRFAFRYWVTDSGPNGSNGDYIGIDTVRVSQPVDGGVGCADPTDIPWLGTDPDAGTTAPGGSEPVNVTVDATDLEEGEHTAQLCVATNDPNAPLVEIPVHLTVTGALSLDPARSGDAPRRAFGRGGRSLRGDQRRPARSLAALYSRSARAIVSQSAGSIP